MKAILFDFDGVLTVDKYGSDSILRYLAENTDVPFEILKKEYYKINKGLLLGQYTHRDVWNDYCKNVGARIDYQLLINSHAPLITAEITTMPTVTVRPAISTWTSTNWQLRMPRVHWKSRATVEKLPDCW